MNKISSQVRAVLSGLSVTLLLLPLTSARASDVERHIQRIQNHVLPPVTVKGEATPTSTLEARMAALRVPGISIAVIRGGKNEWARGFGVTRIGGPPVSTETLFQAASISKLVTAVAVMNAVDAGKLDLDTDVNQYLKGWQLPPSEFTRDRKVTLRDLLTHSAGVSVSGFDGYAAGLPLPAIAQVLNGATPANSPPVLSISVPGNAWAYSGGGYTIIEQVLMDTSGKTFSKLLDDSVLQPWAMRHSTFNQPLSPQQLEQAAAPYRANGLPVAGGPHAYPELAAAGLWTTPSDLAKFAIGVSAVLSGKSKEVLSPRSARYMVTPHIGTQALGPVIGGATARKYFSHGGVNDGYRCFLLAYEDGDGAVLMTNGDGGSRLITELLWTIAQEYSWPDLIPPERIPANVSPASFDRYSGAYQLASGAIATFRREGASIKVHLWGQPTSDLFPSSEREYFSKTSDARWIFSTDTGGRVTGVTLAQAGREQQLQRLDPATAQRALDLSLATAARFKTQSAAKGSDEKLRRLLTSLAQGAPDYDELGTRFATIVRSRLPELRARAESLGALKEVTFKGVEPNGADRYEVTFELDSREYQVLLDTNSRIDAIQFAPAPVPL